jgi:hypothetical protein
LTLLVKQSLQFSVHKKPARHHNVKLWQVL